MIGKVISFYRFTPLPDPDAVRAWQWELCTRLGLTGRIIVASQGINGTIGGDLSAVKTYLKSTRGYRGFSGMEANWGEGSGHDFPKLSVKVRPELVSFGAADQITVDQSGVVGTGMHLSPAQVHQLVADRGDQVAFLDGRNAWEAEIGRFDGAVVTGAKTTADFVAELESGELDGLKHRPVVTYCTGGVRCEVLSALMIQRGFTEVYQVEGGILRYGQEYGDDGLWAGAVRVFDAREIVTFSDHAEVIGRCDRCQVPVDNHVDCDRPGCKGRALRCQACAAECGRCSDCDRPAALQGDVQ